MQNALQISHWLRTGVSELPKAESNKLHLLCSRYPGFLPLKALVAAAEEGPFIGLETVYFSGLNPVLLQELKSRGIIPSKEVTEVASEESLPANPESLPPAEKEEILVHLPASEDTGEVNIPSAEVPGANEEENTEDLPAEAEIGEAAAETTPEEDPQQEELPATPIEEAPQEVVEEPLPAEEEEGILIHLPASEDTEEVNIPPAEIAAEANENTSESSFSGEVPVEESTAETEAEVPVVEGATLPPSNRGVKAESTPETPLKATAEKKELPTSETASYASSLSNTSVAPEPVSANPFYTPKQSNLPAGEPAGGSGAEREEVIQPLYANDYFLHQGVANGEDTIPKSGAFAKQKSGQGDLMIMRSFAEWLRYFQSIKTASADEEAAKRAVKASWQKERLAAALEEEEEEIPEVVFEMALTSIAPESNMASEPLALIYAKQGKWERAIEVYQKLQLRNPQKSAYFAEKIAALEQQHRP